MGILKLKRKGVDYNVLFDDKFSDIVNYYKWTISGKDGRLYAMTSKNKKTGYKRIYMHRMLMAPIFPSVLIDHINLDSLDNRLCNLRVCTKSQNATNRKLVENGSSKYLGVNFNKHANKWVAELTCNKKKFYIGVFNNEDDAAKAYDKVAINIHGEFATLNFKF